MKLTTALTATTVLIALSASAFAQGMSGQGPKTGTNMSNPPQNKNGTPAQQSGAKDNPAFENSGIKQDK